MNYNTRVLPEGNKYVGYALLNDEVVFTTKNCSSAQQASLELEKFTKTNKPAASNVKTNVMVNSNPSTPQVAAYRGTLTRGCCGRG